MSSLWILLLGSLGFYLVGEALEQLQNQKRDERTEILEGRIDYLEDELARIHEALGGGS